MGTNPGPEAWGDRPASAHTDGARRTRIHGLEITQTEHRFKLIELDRFRYTTPKQIQAFVNHLDGVEQHLRLLNTRRGMLTDGTMPGYLIRRTGGVVGLLGRLIEDGTREAMDSGREILDEELLDDIILRREDMTDAPNEPMPPARPPAVLPPSSAKCRPRNSMFDDHGPRTAEDGLADRPPGPPGR
ncbi:hypothetical protein [Streptomyces sp. CAU 1734]|uniref:hypothetical protein n=1 Tax=Streptomyces sp. CAU 1734 TaxID=3140360 RepID=UPI003261C1A5